MIPKKELTKNTHFSRTRRGRITNPKKISKEFKHAQFISRTYYNYSLMYLYQHYGVGHLSTFFPTGHQKDYLIRRLIKFSRLKCNKHNLKSEDFSVQSISKMLEELCQNFVEYRHKQYCIRHVWSVGQRSYYLRMHRCTLSGYGRINYKHHDNDIKSITLKQNHNRIRLMNNYSLKVPYFDVLHTSKSLTYYKHRRIKEVCIHERRHDDFELQIKTNHKNKRHVSRKEEKSAQSCDVNSAKNDFFVLSTKKILSWSFLVEKKYKKYDSKSRILQFYINRHNHGNDNNLRTRKFKLKLRKIKYKAKYLINQWQLSICHYFARHFPIFVIEHLHPFTMRMSKRDKRYRLRKNTNHKLAMIRPYKFRKQLEDIYENKGLLLIEVNPAYTSKNCHHDNHINFHLKVGEKWWWCKYCLKWINRDLNATYNILDWGLNPRHHTLWRLKKKYPHNKKYSWIKIKNLVKYV